MLCGGANASRAGAWSCSRWTADLHGVIWNPGGPQQGRVQHKQSLIVFDRASVVQARCCCFCFHRFHRTKTASLAFLFPTPCGVVFFAVHLLWGVSESPLPPTPPPRLRYRSGLEAPFLNTTFCCCSVLRSPRRPRGGGGWLSRPRVFRAVVDILLANV